MKNLVLFGSANRQNGSTKKMLDLFLEHLGGENYIVDAYEIYYSETPISPCKDCRHCWKVKECSIKDGMDEIYKKLEESDNIIVASPMYFASISGPLKIIIDRFQPYWGSYVRKDKPKNTVRKGVFLSVGGAPAHENQFMGGKLVVKNLFSDTDTEFLGEVYLENSDHDSLETRKDLFNKVVDLAYKMKQANR